MKEFVYHSPTQIYFGHTQGQPFSSQVANLGKTALLLTGGQSASRLGYVALVTDLLVEAGVDCHHFPGIEPNPLCSTIDRIAADARDRKIDFVLALGGGSVMDAAKAIAALLHDGEKHIWDFVLGSPRHRQLKGALPIVAIPTTAATASEVTPYSVVSNLETHGKSVLAYEFFKPRISWLNPKFTVDLPDVVTQDGAADILSHVLENYLLGGDDSPLADRYSESVMCTVLETLPQLLKNPHDEALRGSLLWSSTLALNGMQTAGRNPTPFPLHAIEHSMSAVNHSLAHGRGLATLYPAYFRWLWNKNRGRNRLAKLGRALFGLAGSDDDTGSQFIEQFEKWLSQNHLQQSAVQAGVPEEKFQQVADYAVRTYGDGEMMDVLGPMIRDDIVSILKATG